MTVDYLTVRVWSATCEACSGNLEVSATVPPFAVVNLCQDGRSQDRPDTDI